MMAACSSNANHFATTRWVSASFFGLTSSRSFSMSISTRTHFVTSTKSICHDISMRAPAMWSQWPPHVELVFRVFQRMWSTLIITLCTPNFWLTTIPVFSMATVLKHGLVSVCVCVVVFVVHPSTRRMDTRCSLSTTIASHCSPCTVCLTVSMLIRQCDELIERVGGNYNFLPKQENKRRPSGAEACTLR